MMRNYNVLIFSVLLCLALVGTGCVSSDVDEYKLQIREALDHYYAGIELEKKKDFSGAKEEYLHSVEISPRPAAFLRLGVIELMSNNLDEAERYIDRTLMLTPDYPTANMAKQQIAARKQIQANQGGAATAPSDIGIDDSEIDIAHEPDETIIKPSPASGIEFEAQAPQTNDAAATEPSVDNIGANLVESKSEAETLYKQGAAQFQQKQYAEAEASFLKAIELKPDYADAYNDLGITLEYLGRSAEAITAYKKSIEIGSNSDAIFNLAILEEKRGNYKDSIELYERYLQFDPNSAFSGYAKDRIGKLRRQEY